MNRHLWIRAAAAAAFAFLTSVPAGAAPTELKFNDLAVTVKMSGDMRVRHEEFDKTTPGQVDRQRERFRTRLGLDVQLPNDLMAGFRFATGTGEQVSTNQTYDNLSSEKAFWIDLAYLKYAPNLTDDLSVYAAAGRVVNPFWRVYSSDLVWDEDFNPEGYAEGFEYLTPLGVSVFGNALQMVADEDSGNNKDQWMVGEQAGAEFRLPLQSRLRLAGAYYKWLNADRPASGDFGQAVFQEGNRRVFPSSGTLSNAFGVGEVTGELTTWLPYKTPLSVQGTFIRNLRAKAKLKPELANGFQAGAILGKAKEKGSWEIAYFRKYAETDSTVADVSDSDFGDGGVNRKGHIVWAAYAPTNFTTLKVKFFRTRVVTTSLSPKKDDIDRVQADVSVKF